MRKAFIVGCCFLVVGFVGCNQAPDPRLKAALVGKWQEVGGNRTVEFTDAGQLNLGLKEVVFPYSFEWIGPKQVEWKSNADGGGWPGGRASISIDGDELTMDVQPKGGEAYVSKFKRAK